MAKRGRPLINIDVEAIRAAYAQPGASRATVGKRFGISVYLVTRATRAMKPTPLICECGITVGAIQKTRHKQGTYHRQRARIRALLAKECLTLEEIGNRVGITKQRVQQIAARLGIDTGNARRGVCTLRKRATRKRDHKRAQLLPGLLKRLDAAGIDVSCLKDGTLYHTLTYNGHSIHVSQIQRLSHVSGAHVRHAHVHVGHAASRADFVLAFVAPKDACYVVPASWLPKNVYIPFGRIEGYNGGHSQRDWEQWRERFDLLGGRADAGERAIA